MLTDIEIYNLIVELGWHIVHTRLVEGQGGTKCYAIWHWREFYAEGKDMRAVFYEDVGC